jgi:hypothetical protein
MADPTAANHIFFPLAQLAECCIKNQYKSASSAAGARSPAELFEILNSYGSGRSAPAIMLRRAGILLSPRTRVSVSVQGGAVGLAWVFHRFIGFLSFQSSPRITEKSGTKWNKKGGGGKMEQYPSSTYVSVR